MRIGAGQATPNGASEHQHARRIIVTGLFILLAGCATTTPQPTVTSGVREVEVKVPVLMPCVFVDEVPKVPGTWMNPAQSKEQRRAALLADSGELEEYLLKADSLLRGCAKPREATK